MSTIAATLSSSRQQPFKASDDDIKEIRVMRTSDASVVKFQLDYSQATLQDLKDEITNSIQIDSSQQRLFFLGRELTNSNKTLQKLGIGRHGNFIVHMHVRLSVQKHQHEEELAEAAAATASTTTTTTTTTSSYLPLASSPPPFFSSLVSPTATTTATSFLQGHEALSSRTRQISSFSGFLPYRNNHANISTPTRPNNGVIELLDDDDDDDDEVIVLSNSKRQRLL